MGRGAGMWLPYAGTTQIRFKEYFSATDGGTSSAVNYPATAVAAA